MTGPRYRNNIFQHVLRGGPAGGDFEIFETPIGRAVGHSGGFPGISADLLMYLDTDHTPAVLSNYGSGTPPASQKIQILLGRDQSTVQGDRGSIRKTR